MHLTTRAVVLRQVAYKENDCILTILSEDSGKLTVTARSISKKNSPLAAGTQILCFSEMVLYEFKGKLAVKEAHALRQFSNVTQDISRFSLACYLAQVTEFLSLDGEQSPHMFSLLLNCLHILDTKPDYPLAQVKAVFELAAMCISGFSPMVSACIACGAEEISQPCLHITDGGVHCKNCRNALSDGISLPLSNGAFHALCHIVAGDRRRIFSFSLSQDALENLADVAETFMLVLLERGFPALDYYKKIENPLGELL